MTKAEWISNVVSHREVLRNFILDWHPAARKHAKPHSMKITAGAAEVACGVVREKIKAEHSDDPFLPIGEQFDIALQAKDVSALMSMLDGAWFGVPESTSCWSIPGFEMAVDLMDDPPDEENEERER